LSHESTTHESTIHNTAAMSYRTMFAGISLLVGTTWLFYLRVPVPPWLLAMTWVIGLGIWVWGYAGVFRTNTTSFCATIIPPSANFSPHFKLILAALTLGMLMPPVLSKDVYIYLLQGKLALQGAFTYTDGSLNTLHPWVQYIDPQWADCPNHYGPLPMLLFSLVALAKSVTGALVLLKIAFLGIAVAFLSVMHRIARALDLNTEKVVCAVAFNPIFLLQGLGQLHLDLLTGLLVACFINGLFSKRDWLICGLAIAGLGLTKTLLLPVFLGFWVIYQAWKLKNKSFELRTAISGIGLSLFVFTASYLPIWQGMATLTHPMSYHENKEPVKSVAELAAYVGVYLTNPVVAPDVKDKLVAQKILIGKQITPWIQLLALLLAAFVAWRAFRSKSIQDLVFELGLLTLLIFVLYSPVMHPWYFLLILPFFALFVEKKAVFLYISITFGIANLYEPGSLIDGTIGKVLVIGGTIISILTYFVGVRSFWRG
jgi:Glycosyltransferase family 87